MQVRDNAAELFVAAQFASEGWNVYFPHRDKGFDFIASKDLGDGQQVLRPVQVKGKYPQSGKGRKAVYGFVGGLSELHPEMVLAIPYYTAAGDPAPRFVAYMPFAELRVHSRGYRRQPASFRGDAPSIRPGFRGFFDYEGLRLLENASWGSTPVDHYGWLDESRPVAETDEG